MTKLDSKINVKIYCLNTKLASIVKSLFEVKQPKPSEAKSEAQIDQLISLRFKHSLEEVEQKYNTSLDHYINTTSTMLKIHEDMISATKKLIKKTHVQHENHIQRLEKEIKKEDELNHIMQQVLIKLI